MPTAQEQRQFLKAHGVRGYSTMKKSQLDEAVSHYCAMAVETNPDVKEAEVKDTEVKDTEVKDTEVSSTEKPVDQKPKNKSMWRDWAKQYAEKEGVSYKEALKQGDKYREWKKEQEQ
jgi:hypothetical protein